MNLYRNAGSTSRGKRSLAERTFRIVCDCRSPKPQAREVEGLLAWLLRGAEGWYCSRSNLAGRCMMAKPGRDLEVGREQIAGNCGVARAHARRAARPSGGGSPGGVAPTPRTPRRPLAAEPRWVASPRLAPSLDRPPAPPRDASRAGKRGRTRGANRRARRRRRATRPREA